MRRLLAIAFVTLETLFYSPFCACCELALARRAPAGTTATEAVRANMSPAWGARCESSDEAKSCLQRWWTPRPCERTCGRLASV